MVWSGPRFALSEPVRMRDAAGAWNTRAKLLASGERLIGTRGFQGVSLEQIAVEAGQANKYAVQYYFQSRAGLAQAILTARRGSLEQRRSRLCNMLLENRCLDIESWVSALLWPISEQVDDAGAFSFARFLLRFHVQFERWDGISQGAGLTPDDSATIALTTTLFGLMGEDNMDRGYWKLSLATVTFCSALIGMEMAGGELPLAERMIALSRMIAAALSAP